VSVAGSTLSNNFDGITTRGNVTATDSTFSNNQIAGFDGIQDATVTGCTFNQNGIDGIDGSRDDTVTNSTFSDNGIAGIDGSRNDTVTNSTFSDNGNAGIDGAGTLMVVGSTFSKNNGTAIDGASTLTMTNSTVSGNTYGIAVGDATLSFCTFANNEVEGINGGDVTIGNSILSAPSGGQNCNPTGVTLTSLGHNISSDDSCAAAFTQPGDRNNTDPMIGPLAENGGPTLTHALLPGSPAIDAAASAGAPATDQRGVARPQGAAPDIGAFEMEPTAAPAVTGISPSSGPAPGGTLVTLTGTGFTGATAVHFGAAEASGVTVVNDTTITASSPPGAGVVDVTVTTPQGTSASSPADQFTFTTSAAPTVTTQAATDATSTTVTLNGSVNPHGSATTPTPSDGPRIGVVQRFGFHEMATRLVLRFNEPLDPARAQDVANYAIVADGGSAVAITSAVYDPAAHTVTLTPAHRLNVHQSDELTVVGTGSSGISDTSGNRLDGAGTGHAGSDYQTVVTAANLVLGDAVPGGPARLAKLRKAVARIGAHEAEDAIDKLATSQGAGARQRIIHHWESGVAVVDNVREENGPWVVATERRWPDRRSREFRINVWSWVLPPPPGCIAPSAAADAADV
jgi:hypothetical protein